MRRVISEYAIHYLTATGRLEKAVQEMKRALELEPGRFVMNTFMRTLYYAGRYDEAIDQCRRTYRWTRTSPLRTGILSGL